jgi:hypothetical protein
MTTTLRCTASALALTLALPLAAQDALPGAGADPGETIDEELAEGIIVTGRGLEPALSTGIYATTTIERETILAAPSGRIEDVLRGVAGFQQFRRSDSRSSNPSAQGVTLRALGGNATSRAQVLLDAVPLAVIKAEGLHMRETIQRPGPELRCAAREERRAASLR